MVRRSESDDYIGPAKGVMKWVNKLCRFVLFPFIHPLFFVIILAVLGGSTVGIHYYYGVAYKDIPSWVMSKTKEGYVSVSEKYDINFIDKLTKKYAEKDDVEEIVVNQQPVLYDRPTSVNRQAFKKAQEIPIDVKATIEGQIKSDEQKQAVETEKSITEDKNDPVKVENKPADIVVEKTIDDILGYKIDDSFGLVYTKNPRVVKGQIEVVSANEIKINGEFMFLYGIYTQVKSNKGISGALYLQKMTENKEAECHVIAFTQNADLTAVCIVDGNNINRKMVEAGYSENIGLK